MATYKLIKLETNWADEFDVSSFAVFPAEEAQEFLDQIIQYDWSDNDTLYFGTNEYISFSCVEDLVDSLEVTDITEEEYNTIVKHFGEEYGLIPLSRLGEYANYMIDYVN